MRRAWINYWVDMITGGAFLLCAVTGIVFLFFPGLVRTSGGAATILGVSSPLWHWVHDWSGVVMTAGVGVHTALHLRWLATMTRKLDRGDVAGAPGRSRERARIVAPGAAPLAGVAAAGATAPRPVGVRPAATTSPQAQPSPSAALERLRRLSAEDPADAPRYGRRTFLAGAAAVGGAALLVGAGLASRDGSTTTVTRSDGGGGAAGGSTQGYGQGGSSSGASSGSQNGTTTTSERVAVNGTSCVGCGRCLQACPYGVFGWGSDGRAVASDPAACRLCGRCLQVCPASAITLNG